jgi:hypothetical protein
MAVSDKIPGWRVEGGAAAAESSMVVSDEIPGWRVEGGAAAAAAAVAAAAEPFMVVILGWGVLGGQGVCED